MKHVCLAASRAAPLVARAGVTAGAPASAGRAVASGSSPLSRGIASTFEQGRYTAVRLASDLRVERVYGGAVDAVGRFLTPRAPATGELARSALQLPAHNAATLVAEILIP